jgi:predicted RNase H-like HicB family nuclease
MTKYAVVFEQTETGWCAYYPDLPGLASCGATLEEVTLLTQEGLNLHLSAMVEGGDPIPPPRHVGAMMTFELPESALETTVLAARAA